MFFSDLPLAQMIKLAIWQDTGGIHFNVEDITLQLRNCDPLFSLVPWTSYLLSTWVASLAPRISIGFFPYFDITLSNDHKKHSADLAFDVPKFLKSSLKLEHYAGPPTLPKSAVVAASQLRSILRPSTKIIAVHAETQKGKMWSSDHFIEVLNKFLEREKQYVAFVIGQDYQPLDLGKHKERIISCDGLPLPVACALVAQADLFLGVDSCMLHVADLNRVPGVGLFGPTNCQEWGFRFGPHRHICGTNTMDDITPENVLKALEECCKLVPTTIVERDFDEKARASSLRRSALAFSKRRLCSELRNLRSVKKINPMRKEGGFIANQNRRNRSSP